MSHRAAVVLAALAAVLASAGPARAAVQVPATPPLVQDGPTGRVLIDRGWQLRRDPGDHGLAAHWERAKGNAGWAATHVPNAFNAGDLSSASFIGEPVWYRTRFRLPAGKASLAWRVKFLAVNHRATVWLDGREIGAHTGGYLPFELPLTGAKAGTLHRLVVRVDNRRLPTDFPPSVFTGTEEPRGGWWNWGGIVREVELRPVDRIDFAEVAVTPHLGCAGCPARVDVRVVLRNVSSATQRVTAAGTFGTLPIRFRAAKVGAGATKTLDGSVRVSQPRLWTPVHPTLYRVALTADAAEAGAKPTRAATYKLHSGLRSVSVAPDGRLFLNGAPVHLRGVAMHEDVPGKGAALSSADRASFVASAKDLGATFLRAHYPLHPELEEMADRKGLLLWSEVPVYRMATPYLEPAAVRAAAVDTLRQNILANRNHPSVIVWSIGNELDETMPWPVRRYVAQAARAAHALDPSRPVGMAIEAHLADACARGYEPLDVIGANEYFGWYSGVDDDASAYLDRLHACYPSKAVIVTEFGAEANRAGPVDEKGTYAFQEAFIARHLAIYASKPWLSGASYWALREFVCAPGWRGGNPLANPPMHQKGLLTYAGQPKPAYADVRAAYRATPQIGAP